MRNIIDKWGLEILALIGAFFAPITGYIFYVTLIIIADLITGILKAKKLNKGMSFFEYVESQKLWKSVSKWMLYIMAIMIAQGAMISLWPQYELAKGVLMALTVIEVKSIDENMKEVLGYSIFGKLLELFARNK